MTLTFEVDLDRVKVNHRSTEAYGWNVILFKTYRPVTRTQPTDNSNWTTKVISNNNEGQPLTQKAARSVQSFWHRSSHVISRPRSCVLTALEFLKGRVSRSWSWSKGLGSRVQTKTYSMARLSKIYTHCYRPIQKKTVHCSTLC